MATSWFPANDHPIDKASYTFHVTVPRGREVVANGHFVSKRCEEAGRPGSTTPPSPMASYLATVDVGEWNFDRYRRAGLRYLDAVDPDLYDPVALPSTGSRFALSQAADLSYKRLMHAIAVPAGGATVGFDITRDTEPDWDYVFVEVHTVGQDDWTTLRDLNGHTSQSTGNSCVVWPDIHPFISSHYQTVDQAAGTCCPDRSHRPVVGCHRRAAVGRSSGRSTSRRTPAVTSSSPSATPATTSSSSTACSSTTSSSPPARVRRRSSPGSTAGPCPARLPGSPGNDNDWVIGTIADLPPSEGEIIDGSLARQPEIIRFESRYFGRYPWRDVGGIVDDVEGLGFALETQTRPIYSRDFFTDPVNGDFVIVHELAHQWYGDSLAVARWKHIWLNEGFATYAEWLWSEREGLGTAQEIFDFFYNDFIADDDPWWDIIIGDPGPTALFEFPVYFRGAMTLQVLRNTIGDEDFFRTLKVWAQSRAGDNVTTRQFIRLAERISGQHLDGLFQTWLFTAGKPALDDAARGSHRTATPAGAQASLVIAKKEGLLAR